MSVLSASSMSPPVFLATNCCLWMMQWMLKMWGATDFILEINPFSFPIMAAAPSDAMLIKLVNGMFVSLKYYNYLLNMSSSVVASGKSLINSISSITSSSWMNLTKTRRLAWLWTLSLAEFPPSFPQQISQFILSCCYGVIWKWNSSQNRCLIFSQNLICTRYHSRLDKLLTINLRCCNLCNNFWDIITWFVCLCFCSIDSLYIDG